MPETSALPPAAPATQGPIVAQPRTKHFRFAFALALLTCVTFSNTVSNGFVWDDHAVVLPVAGVERSFDAVLSQPDQAVRSQSAPYYRPLTRLTYLIDQALFGLDPRAAHLENVLLHLAAALVLFALGLRLFGATLPAFVAAVLFAVHPVAAEPVNFIAARNNLLVAFFVLSAWWALLQAQATEKRVWLVVSGGLFALGLFSKETALMMLPFLAVAALLPSLGQVADRTRKLLMLTPLAGAALLYFVARTWVLSSVLGQAVSASDVLRGLRAGMHIIPTYLGLLVWPSHLTVLYAEPEAYVAGAAARAGIWILLLVSVVTLLRGRRPVTLLGIAWLAIHYVPVSNLVPIPSAPLAERFLYLPAIGAWLIVADQLHLRSSRPRWRLPLVLGFAAIASGFALRTHARNLDWQDDVSLFRSATKVDPTSAEAAYNLGVALANTRDGEAARVQWERAVELSPRHANALAQLGTSHAQQGAFERAGQYFARVLELQPGDVETRFNLAVLYERVGQPRLALEQYQAFLRANPVDHPDLAVKVQQRVQALRVQLGL